MDWWNAFQGSFSLWSQGFLFLFWLFELLSLLLLFLWQLEQLVNQTLVAGDFIPVVGVRRLFWRFSLDFRNSWLIFDKFFFDIRLLTGIGSWVLAQVRSPSLLKFLFLFSFDGPAFVNFSTLHIRNRFFRRIVGWIEKLICWIFSLVATFAFFSFLKMQFRRFLGLLAFDLFYYFLNSWSNDCNNRSFIRLFFKKWNEELFNWISYALVSDFEGHFQDFVENFFVVLSRIKGISMKDFVEDDSQRPNIDSVCVVMKFSLLRGYVLFRACDGLHDDLLGAEPEIC